MLTVGAAREIDALIQRGEKHIDDIERGLSVGRNATAGALCLFSALVRTLLAQGPQSLQASLRNKEESNATH